MSSFIVATLFGAIVVSLWLTYQIGKRKGLLASSPPGTTPPAETPPASKKWWRSYWHVAGAILVTLVIAVLVAWLLVKIDYNVYSPLLPYLGMILIGIIGLCLILLKSKKVGTVLLIVAIIGIAIGPERFFRPISNSFDMVAEVIQPTATHITAVGETTAGPIRFESDEQEIVRSFYKERRTVLTPVGYCFTHAPANKFRVIEEAPSHVILEPIGDDLVIGTFTKIPISSGRCR